MNAHEIDYHIYGEEMQYVEIELDPQEAPQHQHRHQPVPASIIAS